MLRRFFLLLPTLFLLATATAQSDTQSLAGRWDATVTIHQLAIPFRLDISGSGTALTGALYNGDLPQTATGAQLQDGKLTLEFDHYQARIQVALDGGRLTGSVEGRFEPGPGPSSYPLTAVRHAESAPSAAASTPAIGGTWIVPHASPKGEQAWRLIVQQKGDEVSATILRVDGDTGALTGSYREGRFLVSHFDGGRPLVAELTPQSDGSLQIALHGAHSPDAPLVGWRLETARAKGLPEPDDFNTHTKVRDPNERFQFRFPDLSGRTVSNDDPQFRGKVYLAVITGTWCPNCHDEAQYLVQLYAKYHSRGLEIVALDFENTDPQDLRRVHAFLRKYGVEYTFLLAGAPSELTAKVPQAVNLNTWPATFFVGKDGRVRQVHAGFAAPASGEFHTELEREYTSEIEALLAEPDAGPAVKGGE